MSLWKLYDEIERPLVPVLGDMEMAGVKIDTDVLSHLSIKMEAFAEEQRYILSDVAGDDFNPRSSMQKAVLLYDTLGAVVKRRTKKAKNPSADKLALSMMIPTECKNVALPGKPATCDHLLCTTAQALLNLTETLTALTNFVYKLPLLVLEDGRVHGSFNQGGHWEETGDDYHGSPATGRLSSSGPNLQNISTRGRWGKLIRQAFIPEKGYVFVAGDVGQEELRIAALLANETRLLDNFDDPNYDPHEETALMAGLRAGVKEDRDLAKNGNYACIYGVMAKKLLAMFPEFGTLERAEAFRRAFFENFPHFEQWHKESRRTAVRLGYVETWFDRRRYLPDIYSSIWGKRAEAERQAVNTPVQGTGADVIKISLRRVWEQNSGYKSRQVLSSHDDQVVETLISEVPRVKKMLEQMTDGILPVTLPMDVKEGKNWGDIE